MNPLHRATKLLRSGGYTCILCDDNRVLTSKKRGVAPLLGWLEAGELPDAAIADRVIGRAAALLLLCGGVRAVYGEVMSAPARGLLREAGVEAEFGVLVKTIRAGGGICPLERAVAGITDPAQAPAVLTAQLFALRSAQDAALKK